MRNKVSCAVAFLMVVLLANVSLAGQVFPLQIDRARYGKSGQGNEVTVRVRRMIQNNSLDFKVTNDSMGGDPNKGADKVLTISYTYRGQHHVATFKEGERCRLP